MIITLLTQIYFFCFSFYAFRSTHWEHAVLGIIQPWDPDYDIKFGNAYRAYPTGVTKNGETISLNPSGVSKFGECINLMVCVDHGDAAKSDGIGGWAPQGLIRQGVRFFMARLGLIVLFSHRNSNSPVTPRQFDDWN